MDVRPGGLGRLLLLKHVGQDAAPAFFGGIYDHNSAARTVSTWTFTTIVHPADGLQLLAMKSLGIPCGEVVMRVQLFCKSVVKVCVGRYPNKVIGATVNG